MNGKAMNRILKIVVVFIGTLILAQLINGIAAFAIGLVVLVVWSLLDSRKQSREAYLQKELGLNPKEAQDVIDQLGSGNRSAAVERIQSAQERQRASLLEQGIDPFAIIPLIGRDIKWSDVVRHVFRVLEFDRAGTTVLADGTVKAVTPYTPYGFLLVESPILNVEARLPIVHRDDFVLATTVYDEPQFADLIAREELLVTYFSKNMLAHCLHYVIVPQGTLERYYEFNNDEHMANPAPEKLFKEFVWSGEIRVGINPNPEF